MTKEDATKKIDFTHKICLTGTENSAEKPTKQLKKPSLK